MESQKRNYGLVSHNLWQRRQDEYIRHLERKAAVSEYSCVLPDGFFEQQNEPNMVNDIQCDRENDYGDAKESHENIAQFWNAYLGRKKFHSVFDNLDATDVSVMLSLMKVSRMAYKRKHDSVLDFASYANFALQFEEK